MPNIKRGVIKKEEKKIKNGENAENCISYGLAVEGYGLREVMGSLGVDGLKCTSNHVMEVKEVI